MKKTTWIVALLGMTAFAVGCSSIKKQLALDTRISTKEYVVESLWVRAPERLNKQFRRSHRMEPVVLDDIVIQGNGFVGITAYERSSGAMIWHFPVSDGVEGGAAVYGDHVYFGGGNAKFYALELRNGKKVWEFELGAQVLAAPTATEDSVYFLSGNNTLYALNRITGKQKWLYRRAQTTNLTIRGGSQPVLKGRRLYVGMSDGYLVAVDSEDGGLLWERPLLDRGRFIDVDATPVLDGANLYVASYDGALFCLDQQDGQVIWSLDEGGATGVTLKDDTVFYSTSQGQVLAIEKDSGKPKWNYKVPQGIATLPKYHKGLLIFGESGGPLRILSASSGQQVTYFDTGRGVGASPYISRQGEVFFVSNEGYLYGVQVSRKVRDKAWDI